jgi:hypothetical protein
MAGTTSGKVWHIGCENSGNRDDGGGKDGNEVNTGSEEDGPRNNAYCEQLNRVVSWRNRFRRPELVDAGHVV